MRIGRHSERPRRAVLPALLLLGLVLVAAAGCGGGNTTSTTGAAATTSTAGTTATTSSSTASTAPAGWQRFSAGGGEIYLPKGFEGGDPSGNLSQIINKLKELGSNYEQIAKQIEANPSAFVLWAFDPSSASSGFLTNVNIVVDKNAASATVEQYVEAVVGQLPSDFKVLDHKTTTIGGMDAGRILTQVSIGGRSGKQAIYPVKGPTAIWVVTYSTAVKDFDRQLPNFEKSMATFKPGP